jgi:hypothetical protein
MATGEIEASWFETALARLLTMRVAYGFRALATWPAVTSGAVLPKELRM